MSYHQKILFKTFIPLYLLVCYVPFKLQAQNGETLFKQKCTACHKIGGGRLVGPDLKGVTTKRSEEWLIKWTKASQDLIHSGDADAKAISNEFGGMIMPNQELPDADIKAIFAYVESQSAIAPSSVVPAEANQIKPSDKASSEELISGQNLFVGIQSLKNGGPSCISCHNVNYKGVIPGGILAKDLTTAFSRMGGDAGIQGILGAPPFPAMTSAYKNNPITDKEIGNLIAFLREVDTDKTKQVASNNYLLLYLGIGGLCLLIILYSIIWFRRKKTTVKNEIYNRQLKSI